MKTKAPNWGDALIARGIATAERVDSARRALHLDLPEEDLQHLVMLADFIALHLQEGEIVPLKLEALKHMALKLSEHIKGSALLSALRLKAMGEVAMLPDVAMMMNLKPDGPVQ